jgi:hypothetical protein
MKIVPFVLFTVLLFAIAIIGCKKDESPTATPPPASGGITTYVGTFANTAESGSLILTFSSAPAKRDPNFVATVESVLTVSGKIKIGVDSVLLTGTYDTTTDSLIVSGGGYTFRGKLTNGHFTGSYTGPHGPGGFAASPSATDGSDKVFCGTSHETSPDTSQHGRFNLIVSGTTVSGVTGDGLDLGGHATGDSVYVTISDVEIARGKVVGVNISGIYYSPNFNSPTITGTWEGSICQ